MQEDWIAGERCHAGAAGGVFQFLRSSPHGAHCTVDMSACDWIGPAPLAAMAAFIHRESLAERTISFAAPEAEGPGNYLSRMGVPELLADWGISHALPPVRKDTSLSDTVLVELSPFTCVEDLDRLALILRNQDVAEDLRRCLTETFFETAENVSLHARTGMGFMAAQVTHQGKWLSLAVADAGRGVLETLRSRGADSDREALRLALNGTSELDDPGHGQGLRRVCELMATHHGWGTLLSGNALMTARGGSLHPWVGRASYSGTIFEATLPVG